MATPAKPFQMPFLKFSYLRSNQIFLRSTRVAKYKQVSELCDGSSKTLSDAIPKTPIHSRNQICLRGTKFANYQLGTRVARCKNSYRPLEVDGEPDELVPGEGGVVAHHGSDMLAEGALSRGVDRLLVVLEADAELGGAVARAAAGRRPVALAATPVGVLNKWVEN